MSKMGPYYLYIPKFKESCRGKGSLLDDEKVQLSMMVKRESDI